MKRILALVFALACAMALIACEPGSANKTESDRQEITVEDFGYFVDDDGVFHYSAKLLNSNQKWESDNPLIVVSVMDDDGNPIKIDRWTLRQLDAGQESYWAKEIPLPDVEVADAQVEVTTRSDFWFAGEAGENNLYTVSDMDSQIDGDKGTFSCNVTLNESPDGNTAPLMVLVLRDGQGNMLGGYSALVNNELMTGQPQSFTFKNCDLPEGYASFEIYANLWM